MTDNKRAILLLNMGGPATLKDVKPFLKNMFNDPEIIPIRISLIRRFVAWMISTSREKKSQGLYKQIGGGSPIRKYTDGQAAGVESRLIKKGFPVTVKTAFTYSEPFVEDVIRDLKNKGVRRFLSLPLYPQYSYTTNRSALNRVRCAMGKAEPDDELIEISSWPTHPLFIKAHANLIEEKLKSFSKPHSKDVYLLFSAHSIPEKLVTKKGDPYKSQVEKTVDAVIQETQWKGPFGLAWQSRLGPVKWIGPSVPEVIERLGAQKIKRVMIVPIAFVSDHVETLCEIDIEFAELAKKCGIEEFKKAGPLNLDSTFLDGLADLALSQEKFWSKP